MSQKADSNESSIDKTNSKSRTMESVFYPKVTKGKTASVLTLGSNLSYPAKSDIMTLQSEKFISATKSVEGHGESGDQIDVSKVDSPNIEHDTVQGRLFLQKKGLNNISM